MQYRPIWTVFVVCGLLLSAGAVPGITVAATDSYGDSCSNATAIEPGENLSGTLSTADDSDVVKVQLNEGDHLDVSTMVPSDEGQYTVDIESDGDFSVKNTSNANWDGYAITDVDGGFESSWEIWAEEDVTVCLEINDYDWDTAYDWSLSTTYDPAPRTDAWADTESESARVDLNGTYTGAIDTPSDAEVMKFRLDEGDHLDMSAIVPAAEDQFVIDLNSDSDFTVKNTSNGNWDGYAITNIDGGFETSWEVWAEEDAIITVELHEYGDGTVPYDWELSSEVTPAPRTDAWADTESESTRVEVNGTYTGAIDTPSDAEVMKFRLEEGDHLDMSAVVPAEEDQFVVDLNSDSDFTVKNTSNGNWDGYAITDVSGGGAVDWEVWAEEDAIITVELHEYGDGTVPYDWELSSAMTPAPREDAWADLPGEARRIAPNGTYTGAIDTPSDADVIKFALEQGSYVEVATLVPAAEDQFVVDINSDSDYSVTGVENGDWDGYAITNIDGGFETKWRITAEENAIITVEFHEYGDATVPYDWYLRTRKNAALGSNIGPSASLTANQSTVTVGETVQFDAADSADPDGSIASYEWDLDGDGEVEATGETVDHRFDTTGSKTVSLTVTDGDGATDTAERTVTVEAPTTEPPTASRTVGDTELTPGSSTTMTVAIEASEDTDRIAFVDTFDPAVGSVSNVTATTDGTGSVQVATGNESRVDVAVADLSPNETVTVTYDLSLPQSTESGTSFAIEGEVLSSAGNVTVSPATVTATSEESGLGTYAGSDNVIQTDELQEIITAWSFGDLTTTQLQQGIQAWAIGAEV